VLNEALVHLAYETARVLASLVALPEDKERPNQTTEARAALIARLDWIRLSGHVHGVDLQLNDRIRLRVAAELVFASRSS